MKLLNASLDRRAGEQARDERARAEEEEVFLSNDKVLATKVILVGH